MESFHGGGRTHVFLKRTKVNEFINITIAHTHTQKNELELATPF